MSEKRKQTKSESVMYMGFLALLVALIFGVVWTFGVDRNAVLALITAVIGTILVVTGAITKS